MKKAEYEIIDIPLLRFYFKICMEEAGRSYFLILTVVTPGWWDLIVYNDHALPL